MTITQTNIDLLIGHNEGIKKQNKSLQANLREAEKENTLLLKECKKIKKADW